MQPEKKKQTKYSFLDGRYIFAAIAIETFGPWGLSAKETLFKIGYVLKEVACEPKSLERLRHKLSIASKECNVWFFGLQETRTGRWKMHQIKQGTSSSVAFFTLVTLRERELGKNW